MLKDYAILKFTGIDAIDFLHAQFTTDIQQQINNTANLTAWCNAKGQVIVTGLLFKTESEIFFILHHSLVEFVEQRLRMFVLRSDVNIENITNNIYFIASKDTQNTEQIILQELGNVNLSLKPEPVNTNTLDDNKFSIQCIKAGILWLTKQHQEQYQPQMLNMDIVNGLSYQKGCYPGQEVIARLHYRGTIKKRLFVIKSKSLINIGDEIYSADEKQGDIINIAKEENDHIALAVCNIEVKDAKNVICNQEEVFVSDTFHS